jgi:uncharacterized protein YkwD
MKKSYFPPLTMDQFIGNNSSMNTILLGALLLLISCGNHSGFGNPDVAKSGVSAENSADAFMELVNDHRAGLGLHPLTHDAKLAAIALTHSQNMAAGSVPFGHTGFSARCSAGRSALGGGNWCAENVAQGQKTIQDAFKAWMNSPGHRANIEQTRATHTGLGMARNTGGTTYWTQVFIER